MLSEGTSAATFIRTLGIENNDIRRTGSAGSGGVGIASRQMHERANLIPRVSAFYSMLMFKGFHIESRCYTSGYIDVKTQILIYAGKSPFKSGSLDQSKDIWGSDSTHIPQIPGLENPGKNIIPIATGFIDAGVSWGCSQKVKGTFISDVEYNGAGGYNNRMKDRTGLVQRDDWMNYNEREGWFNIPVNTK